MRDQYLIQGQNITPPDDIEQVDILITREETVTGIFVGSDLLGADEKVAFDEDLVFYNQQESTDGSVLHLGRHAARTLSRWWRGRETALIDGCRSLHLQL